MKLAFLLLACAAFLLGLSCFTGEEREHTLVLRILGIILAFAGLWAWL